MSNWEKNEEIQILQEYLRIPSVHPNVDYEPIVKFLRRQAKSLQLDFNVYYPRPNKPVIVMTWVGTNPEAPSIMANSHTDVVPVFEEQWTHKPFAAEIENGKIFARGIQDTKALGMMFMVAIKNLQRDKKRLSRTIHVTFVPDEEIGGEDGMKAFVETEEFKNLKVGFVWDEGGAFPLDAKTFFVFQGERSKWGVIFNIKSESGHGSLITKDTAPEKLLSLMNKFYEYRDVQMKILEKNPFNFGETTSINCTLINGGVQINVVAAEFTVSFDIRLGPFVDHVEFENMFKKWCEDIGGIEYHFEQKCPICEVSNADDSSIYWVAMKKAVEEMDYKLQPIICPASTDSRYIRSKGIQALGFLPLNNVPILAHSHDEYMPVESYLRGVEVTKHVLESLGNC